MNYIKLIACIISLFSAMFTASAGNADINLNERRYNVQSGLASNEVNSMAQDENGLIWLATSNGLSRFDGYDFVNYRPSRDNLDFILGSTILDLAIDDGKIWFVTPKGFGFFDEATQTMSAVRDSLLEKAALKTVITLSTGRILVGGATGLFEYTPSTDSVVEIIPSDDETPRIKSIRKVYEDKYGNIWIGTWGNGLYYILNGTHTVRQFVSVRIEKDITVTDFTETRDGRLVLGTWGKGLMCISNAFAASQSVFSYAIPDIDQHHLDWNIVYSIETDDSGNVYAGSPKGLRIFTVDNAGFRPLPYELRGNSWGHPTEIKSLFKDRQGDVWLSDYGSGIIFLAPLESGIKELDLRTLGFNPSSVMSVYQDNSGIIWMGVSGHGVLRYDPEKKTILKDRILGEITSDGNAAMAFIPVEKKNLIVVPTRYNGVYILKVRNNEILSLEHIDTDTKDIRNAATYCAALDQQGNIWVGTKSGLVLLRPDGDSFVKVEPEVLNKQLNYVTTTSICPDLEGNLWLGTAEFGVYKTSLLKNSLTPEAVVRYSLEDGRLNSDMPLCIFNDRKGRIWVGTRGGGLSLYDKKADTFSIITAMHLLPSDEICSISEDMNGNLWVSSVNGFTCLTGDQNSLSVMNYVASDGLNNLSFMPNSVWSDGRDIVYGSYCGLTEFSVNDLPERAPAPKPLITDIQIYNGSGKGGTYNSSLGYPYSEQIKLGWRDKSISIKFAAPDFASGEYLRYAYKLKGLDKDWHYTSSDNRTVIYSNLRSGEYIFQVMAGSSSGDWTLSSPLTLKVMAAPYSRWWAVLLYIVLILAILFFTAYSVIHRVRLRNRLKLEQMERVKSEEVNNAKLVFFTNVSHELFTPLTVMSVSIDRLLEKSEDPTLNRILRSNLDRLRRLLQQILEFRKAESSNLKLKVRQTEIVSFVRHLCDDNFAPLSNSEKSIVMMFSSSVERLEGYIDRDKLDKILYNLISNAYKYNRPGGSVFVTVSTEESPLRYVVISVKDTGYGINRKKQTNLFKRFYEGDYREFNTSGTGIGLSLTKDLVELHKGTIKVESIEGEGSVFTIRIPIDKGAFTEDQIQKEVIVDDNLMTLPQSDTNTISEDKDTVLIVEDNEELLYMMKDILSSKYNALTAKNGEEALALLSEYTVDLIITDLLMPVMDGIQLCKRVRTELSTSHLPIIVLSAKIEVESKLESFASGADAYIAKPFDIKVLMAQVDGLIQNRRMILDNFRHDQSLDVGGIINTDLDKQFIEKAVTLIESHISESDFSINEFNKAMNMSNSTLYRKIKGLTGMSPKEFIRNIRFKYACKLLLEKSSSIAEVAYMVGFSDAKYFSICFKKEFGITPSAYINNNRPNDVIDIN